MRIWHQSFRDLDRVPLYRATLARHAAAVMPPGDEVVLHGLRPGTYGAGFALIHVIRHRYFEFLNEAQVCEAALATERAGYDAFALACFYDPGLCSIRSLVDVPYVGLSETTMLVACSLGHRFGLVSLESSQPSQHEALAQAYGLRDRLAAVVPMHPPIDEYMLEADKAASQPLVRSFEQACERVVRAGADVVIPGDVFLDEMVWRTGLRTVTGVPVLDALSMLFHHAAFMAGLRACLGTGVSRVLHYARPPAPMLADAGAAAGSRPMAEDDFSGLAAPDTRGDDGDD